MEKLIEVYKDNKVFSKMMEKIQETKDQYYIDTHGVVFIKSGDSKVIDSANYKPNFRQTSGWVPFLDMAKKDERLHDDLIASKVIEVLMKGSK